MNDPVEYLPNHDDHKSAPGEPGWYFWDEIWISAFGPYPTEVAAREALANYAKELDEPPRPSPFSGDVPPSI